MKTQRDIIIKMAFEIMLNEGETKDLVSLSEFQNLAYKDKRFDKWLTKASSNYMEIITKNLHKEL